MYNFVHKYVLFTIISSFLSARVAANLINVPLLPVGLYEWKITPAHPQPTIMFKNILRTFEAETLKIVKNIQP